MQFKFTPGLLLLLFYSCFNQNETTSSDTSNTIVPVQEWQIASSEKWLVNSGLENIESIVYDAVNQVFYASNGQNYGEGTSGFISRISKDGSLQELKWVSKLNRPTGMAIHDSLLYVADFNTLIVINTGNGNIISKYQEPIANSGLNDVAVSDKGEVYVTASFIHSILQVKDGQLVVWKKDEGNLKWANGITTIDTQLIVGGLDLNTIHSASKVLSKIQLKKPVQDFEGIESDGAGGYFLTTVDNSSFFHVNQGLIVTKLLEDNYYFGDLEYDEELKTVYIPRGNKETSESFISVLKMDRKGQ